MRSLPEQRSTPQRLTTRGLAELKMFERAQFPVSAALRRSLRYNPWLIVETPALLAVLRRAQMT